MPTIPSGPNALSFGLQGIVGDLQGTAFELGTATDPVINPFYNDVPKRIDLQGISGQLAKNAQAAYGSIAKSQQPTNPDPMVATVAARKKNLLAQASRMVPLGVAPTNLMAPAPAAPPPPAMPLSGNPTRSIPAPVAPMKAPGQNGISPIATQLQEQLQQMDPKYTVTEDPNYAGRMYVRRPDSPKAMMLNMQESQQEVLGGKTWQLNTSRKQTAVNISASLVSQAGKGEGEVSYGIRSQAENAALAIDYTFQLHGAKENTSAALESSLYGVLTGGSEYAALPAFPTVSQRLPAAAAQTLTGSMPFVALKQTGETAQGYERSKLMDYYQQDVLRAQGNIPSYATGKPSNITWEQMQTMTPGLNEMLEPKNVWVRGGKFQLGGASDKEQKRKTTRYGREAVDFYQIEDLAGPVLQEAIELRGRATAQKAKIGLQNVLFPGENAPRRGELRTVIATSEFASPGGALHYANPRDVSSGIMGIEGSLTQDMEVQSLYDLGTEKDNIKLNDFRKLRAGAGNTVIGTRTIGENEEAIFASSGQHDFDVRGVSLSISPYMNQRTGAMVSAPGPGVVSTVEQAKILQERLGIPVNIGEAISNKALLNIEGIKETGGFAKTMGWKYGEAETGRSFSVPLGKGKVPISAVTAEMKNDAAIAYSYFGARTFEQTSGAFSEYVNRERIKGGRKFTNWFKETYQPQEGKELQRPHWTELGEKWREFTGRDESGYNLAGNVFRSTVVNAPSASKAWKKYDAAMLPAGTKMLYPAVSDDFIAITKNAEQRAWVEKYGSEEGFEERFAKTWTRGETQPGARNADWTQTLQAPALMARVIQQRVPEYAYKTDFNPDAQRALSEKYPDLARASNIYPNSPNVNVSRTGVAIDELRGYYQYQKSAALEEGATPPTRVHDVTRKEAGQIASTLAGTTSLSAKERIEKLQEIVGSDPQMLRFQEQGGAFMPHPTTVGDVVYNKFGKEFAGISSSYFSNLGDLSRAAAEGRELTPAQGFNVQERFFGKVGDILTSAGGAVKSSQARRVDNAIAGSAIEHPSLAAGETLVGTQAFAGIMRKMGVKNEGIVRTLLKQAAQAEAYLVGTRYPQTGGSVAMLTTRGVFGAGLANLIGEQAYNKIASSPFAANMMYGKSSATNVALRGDADLDKYIDLLAATVTGKGREKVFQGTNVEEMRGQQLTVERALQAEKELIQDPSLRNQTNAYVQAGMGWVEPENLPEKVIGARGDVEPEELQGTARAFDESKQIGMGTGWNIGRSITSSLAALGGTSSELDKAAGVMAAAYQLPLDFMLKKENAAGSDFASILSSASYSKKGELLVKSGVQGDTKKPQWLRLSPEAISGTDPSLSRGSIVTDFLAPIAKMTAGTQETKKGKPYLYGAEQLSYIWGRKEDRETLTGQLAAVTPEKRGEVLEDYLSTLTTAQAQEVPAYNAIAARATLKANKRDKALKLVNPEANEVMKKFEQAQGTRMTQVIRASATFFSYQQKNKGHMPSAAEMENLLRVAPDTKLRAQLVEAGRRANIPIPMEAPEEPLSTVETADPEEAERIRNLAIAEMGLTPVEQDAYMKAFDQGVPEEQAVEDAKWTGLEDLRPKAPKGTIDNQLGGRRGRTPQERENDPDRLPGEGGLAAGQGPMGNPGPPAGGGRGGNQGGDQGGNKGGGGFGRGDWKPASPTAADLAMETAYGRITATQPQASRLVRQVGGVLGRMGFPVEGEGAKPLYEQLGEALRSDRRGELLSQITPETRAGLKRVGTTRAMASSAWSKVASSTFVGDNPIRQTVGTALQRESPFFAAEMLNKALGATPGANADIWSQGVNLAAEPAFLKMQRELEANAFGAGQMDTETLRARATSMINQRPEYGRMIKQAMDISKKLPPDLMAPGLGKVAEIGEAIKVAGVDIKTGREKETIEIPQQQIDSIKAYKAHLDELSKTFDKNIAVTRDLEKVSSRTTEQNRLLASSEQTLGDIKKDRLATSVALGKEVRTVQLGIVNRELEAMTQQFASGQITEDLPGKYQTARAQKTKLEGEQEAELVAEKDKGVGGFMRRTLGGFGMMYMSRIAGLATGGLGFGLQERLAMEQSGSSYGNMAFGSRDVVYNADMALKNQTALSGLANNPMTTLKMLEAQNSSVQGIRNVGGAALGTFAMGTWMNMATPAAAGLGALVGIGAGALDLYSRSQDEAGLAYRLGSARSRSGGYHYEAGNNVWADLTGGKVKPGQIAADAGAGWDYLARNFVYTAAGITGNKEEAQRLAWDTSVNQLAANAMDKQWSMSDFTKTTGMSQEELYPYLQKAAQGKFLNYSSDAVAKATAFISSRGQDEKWRPTSLENLIKDYESSAQAGVASSADLAKGGLAAFGWIGENPMPLVRDYLRQNLSTGQREGLQAAEGLAQQLGASKYIAGVGVQGGQAIDVAKFNEATSKLLEYAKNPLQAQVANASSQAYLVGLQTGRVTGSWQLPTVSANISGPEAAFQSAQYQAQASIDQQRLSSGQTQMNRLYGYGREAEGQQMYKYMTDPNRDVRSDWFTNRLFGQNDPMAYAAVAQRMQRSQMTGGPSFSNLPGLSTINGRDLSANMAAFTDTMLQAPGNTYTGVTGLNWSRSSLQLGNQFPSETARKIWGDNWEKNPAYNKSIIKAAVEGYELPAPITMPDETTVSSVGGTMGIERQQSLLSYQQSLYQLNVQRQSNQMQYAFTTGIGLSAYNNTIDPRTGKPFGNLGATGGFWGLEDKQRQLQYAQQEWQFGFQQKQINVENQNWQANFALNMRQTTLQRGWTQQDWAIQAGIREQQWGWQQEDFQEESRFMTGRQRRLAERGQKRATITHEQEEDQIDRSKTRQKELWQLEDERFSLQKTQHAQAVRMQQEQLDASRRFFAEQKKLTEQQTMLTRAYFIAQQKLQNDSINTQAKYIEEQRTLQVTMEQLQVATELWKGSLNTLTEDAFVKLNAALIETGPLLKGIIDEILRLKDGATTPPVPADDDTPPPGTPGGPKKPQMQGFGRSNTFSTTMNALNTPTSSVSTGFIALNKSNSSPQDARPINIYLGNELMARMVLDLVTNEVRNG